MIGGIRNFLGVSDNPMFLWISSNSSPLNLLLVQYHPAEIIIVKRFTQGRNSVTRMRVGPRLFDQGIVKTTPLPSLSRYQLILSATLPTKEFRTRALGTLFHPLSDEFRFIFRLIFKNAFNAARYMVLGKFDRLIKINY